MVFNRADRSDGNGIDKRVGKNREKDERGMRKERGERKEEKGKRRKERGERKEEMQYMNFQ